MTTKEELKKMAIACEECSGKDESSLDEHLETCPICKEYKEKAEKISMTMESVRSLTSKSEEERKKIFTARMEALSTIPVEKRISAIREMLDAISELSEEDRIKIVKTRIDVMTSLSKGKREILMGTLKQIMSDWTPERKEMEKRAVMVATQDYFILKRIMVRMMFKKMLS